MSANDQELTLGQIAKHLDAQSRLRHTERVRRQPTTTTTAPPPRKSMRSAPLEMSSKRPVNCRLPAFHVPSTTKSARDPRFDAECGFLDERRFHEQYDFLDRQRLDEIERLRKKASSSRCSAEERNRIRALILRLSNQNSSARQRSDLQRRRDERRQKRQELVESGAPASYIKPSDERQLSLLKRFDELKKSGGLDKYVQKRRQRNAAKERKHCM